MLHHTLIGLSGAVGVVCTGLHLQLDAVSFQCLRSLCGLGWGKPNLGSGEASLVL